MQFTTNFLSIFQSVYFSFPIFKLPCCAIYHLFSGLSALFYEAQTLLKHLKTTGHQPSSLVEKRKIYSDYKECYTCKEEFDGYFNLMTHRKIVHPSQKKCRNFPSNCKFE